MKAVSPSPRSDGKYHPPIRSSAKLLSKHFNNVKLIKKSKRKIFKSFKKELVTVLITIDEKTYEGGKMPDYHPIAWYHKYDGGRAFYTEWGHHPEAFTEPLFLQHLAGAIKWALTK